MLELEDLKKLHDKAYTHGQVPREQAADDLLFYWVTQWDDTLLAGSDLAYRGEFNVLRKAGRKIIGDLRENPVQVDFKPEDDNREDDADFLDGLYRTSCRDNVSIEAFDNAKSETVVCGVGGWELYATYKYKRDGSKKQVIKRRPLYEANNQVFWDPNAKHLDKSDAKYVSVLKAYSRDGYIDLVNELTGEDIENINVNSFASPEHSYTFPWVSDDEKFYVTNFYHSEKVTQKVYTLTDPFGVELTLNEDEYQGKIDDLIDDGYEIESESEIETRKVKKYIASGEKILKTYDIPGSEIPVVPSYGERNFVEGTEYYEGVTKLAKDPQRLRNFQLSYLADIVSRSPRPKPIMVHEQIKGYEFMYEDNGADNNYPYYLQNRFDHNGRELPLGPAGAMPEQQVPNALIQSIALSREAVEDVANPGLPQDIADPDVSGKAVLALQARLDEQSIVYQQNMKFAMRRDGQIFASMASVIYDSERREMVTSRDGKTSYINVMEPYVDQDSGEMRTRNNLQNIDFEVWADIGPDYSTRSEQTAEKLLNMIQMVEQGDPIRNILILKALKLMNGVDFDDVREYANRQLMVMGLKEPETEEDAQYLADIQSQPEEPSADVLLAQAEMLKGQAAQMRERRELLKAQADIQTDVAQTEIDAFEAQTDRLKLNVDAAKAGAEIQNKQADTLGKQIDAAQKAMVTAVKAPRVVYAADRFRASVN